MEILSIFIFSFFVLITIRLSFQIIPLKEGITESNSFHTLFLKKDSSSKFASYGFNFKEGKIVAQIFDESNGSLVSSSVIGSEIHQLMDNYGKSFYTFDVCGNNVQISKNNQILTTFQHPYISEMTYVNSTISDDIQWKNISFKQSGEINLCKPQNKIEKFHLKAGTPGSPGTETNANYVLIWTFIGVGTFMSKKINYFFHF